MAAASQRVRLEWRNRIEAEYRSAAISQHLTLWLIQCGVSPDLIGDGLRIVSEEITHAELSHEVYRAAGGDSPPQLDRAELELPRRANEPVELDVVRWGVQLFCLGETVAVPLFKHLREPCTEPSAREALDQILRDEVGHRDFGWELLEAMLSLPMADAFRELVASELPRMFAGLERSYGEVGKPATDDGDLTFHNDDRLWGLAPPAEYAPILQRTFERDYKPRFADLGIDAAAAWSQRRA